MSYFGSAGSTAGATNVSSQSCTLPASIVAGDVILVGFDWSNTNGATVNTPTGYTPTQNLVQGSLSVAEFAKVATGSEGGTTLTVTLTGTSTRCTLLAGVYRGNTGIPTGTALAIVAPNPTVASTTHTSETAVAPGGGEIVSFCYDKGSGASSSFSSSTYGATRLFEYGSSGTSTVSIGLFDSAGPVSSGAQGFGTITGTANVTAFISSVYAFTTAAQTLSPGGVASGEAVGSHTVSISGSSTQNITGLSGIGSAEAFGSDTVALAPSLLNVRQLNFSTSLEFTLRTINCSSVGVNISTHADMSVVAASLSGITPDAQGRINGIVTGLTANTQYYWQAFNGSTPFGAIGLTNTLPGSGSLATWTHAFWSCITQAATDAVGCDALRTLRPTLTSCLGDYDYADPSVATDVGQAAVWDTQQNSVPGLYAMERDCPHRYIRSDHDGAEGDNFDSTNPVAQNSINGLELAWPHSHFADSRSPQTALYHSVVIGRRRIIYIDIRTIDRSPGNNTDNGSKTMLGATQEAWLRNELIQPEPWKTLVMDTQWMGAADTSPPVKADWWPAYQTYQATVMGMTGWSTVREIVHGDCHCIGYATPTKNASWGGISVTCASQMAQTGGGRDLSTFSFDFNNSGTRGSCFVVFTYTDDGTTMQRTSTGYDATNVATYTFDTVTLEPVAPSGIASGEAIGSHTLTYKYTVTPSGLVTAEAFGSDTITKGPVNTSPTGVASSEAFGSATVQPGAVTAAPGGVATAEAFGSDTLSGVDHVTPTGLTSLETFGSDTVSPGAVSAAPSGIASAEALGSDVVGQGAVSVSPPAVTTAETFGSDILTTGAVTTAPSGVGTSEAFGSDTVSGLDHVSPTGLTSAEAFGSDTVAPGPVGTAPTGIASGEALGSDVVSAGGAVLSPSGVASAEAEGNPLVQPGVVTLLPSGILTAESLGSAVLTPGSVIVAPVALTSSEAFGSDSVSIGAVTVSPSGLTTAEAFGVQALHTGGVFILPAGFASLEAFGLPTAAGVVYVSPSGIGSVYAVGVPVVASSMHVSTTGLFFWDGTQVTALDLRGPWDETSVQAVTILGYWDGTQVLEIENYLTDDGYGFGLYGAGLYGG